jgi:sulfur carrier protein ThiS
MTVNALFHGILSDWVGVKTTSFDLPAKATYADLLREIGLRYGSNMPPQLWDHEAHIFNGPVLAEASGKVVESNAHLLQEGDEVKLYLMIAGG